jgi:ABC-2 type transport system ATP-binding protein
VTNAIQAESLVKTFRRTDALRELNLSVPEGAIFALVGPNGAGKTTAIKVLMNILLPTRGHATVLGMDSTQLRGREFQEIGYVSENQEMPEWMRVDAFFAFLRPLYPNWDQKLEEDLVRQFDLPLNRKLSHLSRGMKMKAALASSLAYRPKLIVLDEPFTGLDPFVREQLIQSLLERAAESTVLISSHDLGEIESFASHVGYLDLGRLRFSEELSTLMNRFREVELTFDAPPPLPSRAPSSWMQLNGSAAVVRFVESSFEPEKTRAEAERVFGNPRDVSFNPMSLRSIFLAMAKRPSELGPVDS